MAETVVHVTTIEEWKSVLDVWFKQGYTWIDGTREYVGRIFEAWGRFLSLCDTITFSYSLTNPNSRPFIEYTDFMAQKKEGNKMATVYEVSQSVFDELQRIRSHEGTFLIGAITLNAQLIKSIEIGNKAILRYLADDPAIEFKVKEPLYRLWAIDQYGDKVYFTKGLSIWGGSVTGRMDNIFTAPLEEIKKWQTPAWSIEEVN